jgi:hypothetical protein
MRRTSDLTYLTCCLIGGAILSYVALVAGHLLPAGPLLNAIHWATS